MNTTTLHKSLSWSGGLNYSKFFNNTLSRQHQISQQRKMVSFECGSSSALSAMNSCTCNSSKTTTTSNTSRYYTKRHHERSESTSEASSRSQMVLKPQRTLPRPHNPQSLVSLIRTVMDSEDSSTSGDESPKMKCKLHKQFQSTESLSLPTESQIVINLPTFTVNCIGFLRTQIHKFVKYFNTFFNKAATR